MSEERDRPKWGSESAEGDATAVEESPLAEPVDPLAMSMADGDAAPDTWSLSQSGNETDPALIAKLDELQTKQEVQLPQVHLPSEQAAVNPFEHLEDSTTERVAGPPVVIGPHAAPPIIGAPRKKKRDQAISAPPAIVTPDSFEPATLDEPVPSFSSLEPPSVERSIPAPEPSEADRSELLTKILIGVGIVSAAALTITVIAVVVALLTAR